MSKLLWVEQYQPCGCSTEAAKKSELLGYCGTHGSQRSTVYKLLKPRKAKP